MTIASDTGVPDHSRFAIGFDDRDRARVHELLRRAKSAAEVANAAQSFGQEDDISVISVTRTGKSESAAA